LQSAFDVNRCRWPRSCRFAALACVTLVLCVAAIFAFGIRSALADTIETDTASGAGLYNDPTNGLGSWIWDAKVSDNQICLLWKSFVIPVSPGVTNAHLKLTVDNEFTVFLDGRELGHGAEWRELFVFDLTPLLSAGRHVLLVKAFNSYSFAGMLLGLQVDLADGRRVEVKSDDSWRIIPTNYFRGKQTAWFNDALTSRNIIKNWKTINEAKADWPAATVEAPFGALPWWTNPQSVNKMPVLLPIRLFFWQTAWFQALVLTAWLVPLATCVWLVAKLTLQRKEQWLLQRERSRIAMDIHDDLGSKITQLVLHGEVTQSELPADARMRPQIDLICHDARDVLSVLDEILWAVNPKRDDLRDFTTYICSYAEQFLKFTSIQCLLDVDTEEPDLELNLPLRRGLLMVTKEALNNAVKHSGATELRLQIRCEHGRLAVTLQDNGKGFDPVTAGSRKRNGLPNMGQRMAELGGTYAIVSRPGEGCRIEFSAPLRQSPWRFWSRVSKNRARAIG
jgi:signal transduction histidine kinase